MSPDERRPAGPVGEEGEALRAGASSTSPSSPPPAGEADQVERDLDALLADAEAKKDEYLELAKRTQADFENFRKRMAAEVEKAAVKGKAALVGELVHVVDNLERALDVANGDKPGHPSEAEESLAHGILLTHRDLCMALSNHGVEIFDPTGEKFDPTQHEALTTKPAPESEPGTVVETMQKGYRLGSQLIRPARVVVSA